MGNSLAGRKTTKVMTINGETFKLKTPVKAEDVLKDYPGHVLLESESVKHYGTRAKPLEAQQELVPKRLYFLVVLPEAPTEKNPRRVRSGVNMNAKERLESLMLSRRSASDLTLMKGGGSGPAAMKVKLRVPRAEVERLMKESENEGEAAEKIMQLYMAANAAAEGSTGEAFKTRQKRVSFVAMDSIVVPVGT